ncbi:MAG TPA: hypothetical protein VGE36_09930 [Roseateles sp.]
MHKALHRVAGLCLALLGGAAQAAAIGSGLFGIGAHILGTVKPGDVEEVRTELAGPMKTPLSIDIDPRSHPVELMKIGLWLRERQPLLKLKGSCVGNCARSILLAARVQAIQPGTVIAFGGRTEVPARLKDQIDAGEFFTDDDERSRRSRETFLKSFETPIQQSLALRSLLAQQVQLPAQVQAFVDSVVASWRVDRLSYIDDEAKFSLKAGRHRCMWWVPDAQGLRQLGLDVPDYQPVDRTAAARLLKTPEAFIYVGPALETLPEQSLCEGQKNFSFPLLP